MFGTMLTKLLWFVTAVTIQGGYLPSSCQIDTASSAVYIALYPTNRSLREELIDTLKAKHFFQFLTSILEFIILHISLPALIPNAGITFYRR